MFVSQIPTQAIRHRWFQNLSSRRISSTTDPFLVHFPARQARDYSILAISSLSIDGMGLLFSKLDVLVRLRISMINFNGYGPGLWYPRKFTPLLSRISGCSHVLTHPLKTYTPYTFTTEISKNNYHHFDRIVIGFSLTTHPFWGYPH